jgi:hypothetical protein
MTKLSCIGALRCFVAVRPHVLQTHETPMILNMHAHAIGAEVRRARSDRVHVMA